MSVKTRADQGQPAVRRQVRGALAEHPGCRPQREGHPGQTEVQRRKLPRMVHRRRDRAGSPDRGRGEPFIPEMPVPLEQRQHDPRRAAVQRGVELVVIRPARPGQSRPVLPRLGQQPFQGAGGQSRTVREGVGHD